MKNDFPQQPASTAVGRPASRRLAPRIAVRHAGTGLFICVLFVAGCQDLTYKPVANGPASKIAVVTDSASWNGPVGDAIRTELGGWIQTLPAPERMFTLEHRPLSGRREFDYVSSLKNVIFVAPVSDSTNESRFLQQVFSPDALNAIRTGEGGVVPRTDVWRQRQQIYYVAAQTPDQLVTTIRQSGPEMREQFNRRARQRLEVDMFEKARQTDIEDQMLDRHGFRVKVQHDYIVAADTTNLLWLRRILTAESWRSVMIHYEENGNPAELSPAWINARRDSLARRYLQGNLGGYARTDYRRPLETVELEFLGRFAYETRGLWHMVDVDAEGNLIDEYGMGGPQLTYTFYDQPTGRIYMIDGMVFAPGYDKREFLRQVEVIAHTFQTAEDLESVSL